MSAADDLPFDRRDGSSKPCPICRKPSNADFAPFCSKRCADVDLHRWLRGVYVVPDDDPASPEETTDDRDP